MSKLCASALSLVCKIEYMYIAKGETNRKKKQNSHPLTNGRKKKHD